MNLTPVSRATVFALALLLLTTAPLAAQNLLVTEHKGKSLPVVKARDARAMVVFEGKPVIADGRRFALHKVSEYSPAFISVRDLEVSTHYMDVNASAMNHEFRMRARLESPYWLKDVFIVLELDTDSAGKVLFLYEVGDLEPRQPKSLSLVVPLASGLGEGKYLVHLFSEGMEVLQSMIDPGAREAALDRMTTTRIASVKDAEPRLFVGPQPEYPRALMKAKTSGQVVVSLRIGANGRVYDPAVKSATDPAFGEAALTAVRLWRFLPQVKNGRPVETKVNVPLNFAPPEEVRKKP